MTLSKSERFFSYSSYLKETFGKKVYRVTVNAGFSCPNRDGTKGRGGCLYCLSGSDYAQKGTLAIREQIKRGIEGVRRRYGAEAFLVYFQAYSNTYAPADVLYEKFSVIKDFKEVVGLIVGTRPDCFSDEAAEVLKEFSKQYFVWLELGLESAHFKSLRWMNRKHGVSDFIDALLRAKGKGISVCSHVILYLPTEDFEDMMETADLLASLKIDGVKLHPLHVLKGTGLEKLFWKNPFKLPLAKEYAEVAVEFIRRLPKRTVIQRLTADAPETLLIAPNWCSKRKKNEVIQLIRKKFEELDAYQGDKCRF